MLIVYRLRVSRKPKLAGRREANTALAAMRCQLCDLMSVFPTILWFKQVRLLNVLDRRTPNTQSV